MEKTIYDNGSFCVFQFNARPSVHDTAFIMYGIRRTDRKQDGMIFANADKDFCIKVADDYKKAMI